MRTVDRRSREIVEIISDVVKRTSDDCEITIASANGCCRQLKCPTINYVFGNGQYVKDTLDILSKTPKSNAVKFPLIALFCPFNERRDSADYYSKAKVRLLIACSSSTEWSNEKRRKTSFENILRPVYRRFLEALREDGRFAFGYDEQISHEYSENYSYGKYGALTESGELVSEPIDAINITNLLLTVKNPNCR